MLLRVSYHAPAAFDVNVASDGDRAVLVLEGELDFSVAPRVRAALERSHDSRTLVFDLRGLTFMDSSGIHLLVETRERCRTAGRTLLVVRGTGYVHRGLAALGLEREFEFVDEPLVPA
jgi:anti-sigma B factor antagonist